MAMILTVTVIMTLMINLHVRIYVHFIWMTKCTFVYFCNQELSNRDFIEDRNSEVRIPSIPTRLCWRISLLPLLFVYLVHLKSTGISKDAEFWRNPPPLRTRKQASTEADTGDLDEAEFCQGLERGPGTGQEAEAGMKYQKTRSGRPALVLAAWCISAPGDLELLR